MRSEIQPWNAITARLTMPGSGGGITGLSAIALIKRLSDGYYWNGATWQVGATTVAMTEPDATNEPGVYEAAVLLAQLDYALGLKGYRFHITETTTPVREAGFIKQESIAWAELVASYVTAGSFGHRAALALGIGGQVYHRIKIPTYDAEGRLLTCSLVAYNTSADAVADASPLGTLAVTCTYDVDGNLATLKSV